MPDRFDNLYFDSNGVLTERRWIGGQEVIVHYDDIPETDKTVHRGIPVTTPLRTIIDIAPDLSAKRLRQAIEDCLTRGLFTSDDAWARIAQPDMVNRRGAQLLGQHLEQTGRRRPG